MGHISGVISCMSPVTCHLSPVICHLRQQPQPQTLALLTPALRTVGWFPKTEKPKKHKILKKFETFQKLHRLLASQY